MKEGKIITEHELQEFGWVHVGWFAGYQIWTDNFKLILRDKTSGEIKIICDR